MTNFRIYYLKSRLIGSRRAYRRAEEPRCAEGASRAPGVPWRARLQGPWHPLGPGNTNVAGWVPGSWVVPRYSPPRYPPSLHQPRVYPPHRTRPAVPTAGPDVLYRQFDHGQGDPRGGIRTALRGRSIPPSTDTVGTLLIDLAAGARDRAYAT